MIKLKDENRPSGGTARSPANTLEQDVFVNAQKTADWLMRDVEDVLKDVRLSPTQYNVLRILRSPGTTSAGGMACHEIGQRMITRDPDLTRLLDRLEDRELITRSRERQDRRVIRVRITPDGLRLLRDLDEPIRALHRKQLSRLGDKRLRLLKRLLEMTRQRPLPED